jgi:protein-tyrosine phosphatase
VTRHVEFDRLHNFRDLGGYVGAGGRTVRWGRLYRSDSLAKLDGADWKRFQALGVRTVIDLRYPWEIALAGRVPDSDALTYVNLSIEHRTYDQPSLGPDVEPVAFLGDRFAEVLDDGVVEVGQALQLIAAADDPLVFHCASGKDRTGIVAALVLALLGVSDDDIVADFALTERARERLVADWVRGHPESTITWPAYGQAPPALMVRFLADLRSRFGSVEAYVEGAGVDGKVVRTLQRSLLTGQLDSRR